MKAQENHQENQQEKQQENQQETALLAADEAVAAPPEVKRGWLALSPINRRRLANFKANRRGYWSFWIFLVLFVLSLFAEFIANDRPIYVNFKGNSYFPILRDYVEQDFLPPEEMLDPNAVVSFQDTLVMDIVNKDGFAIWPPIAFSGTSAAPLPMMPDLSRQMSAPSPPTWMLSDAQCEPVAARTGGKTCADIEWNWLGTDDTARDVLARLIYGFRVSVVFALLLTIASSIVGVAAGAVQGFYGGWVDLIFQRVIEVVESMPRLFLLIIIASFFIPSFWTILVIMSLFAWTALVGVVRAEFLRARNFDYVKAARALGLKDRTIMIRHVLPNAMVATITMLPFITAGAIDSLTALDFLGLGMPPGSPSLGDLAKQANASPQSWWLGVSTFFTVSILLTLLVFIGEAVRDAFDPRKTA
jgi:microcin C transport system permease protein